MNVKDIIIMKDIIKEDTIIMKLWKYPIDSTCRKNFTYSRSKFVKMDVWDF